jgi:hypothetical protein
MMEEPPAISVGRKGDGLEWLGTIGEGGWESKREREKERARETARERATK